MMDMSKLRVSAEFDTPALRAAADELTRLAEAANAAADAIERLQKLGHRIEIMRVGDISIVETYPLGSTEPLRFKGSHAS